MAKGSDKRRTGRLPCPVCKHESDAQPTYTDGPRTFQAFICDVPDCLVSSFVVEWRSE